MPSAVNTVEWIEDYRGGNAFCVVAGTGVPVLDDLDGLAIVPGAMYIFHCRTILLQAGAGATHVCIYDGPLAVAANLRRRYRLLANANLAVTNIRGLRFTNDTSGIICVCSTSSVHVHMAGPLRLN